jgi:hypothetical protein
MPMPKFPAIQIYSPILSAAVTRAYVYAPLFFLLLSLLPLLRILNLEIQAR